MCTPVFFPLRFLVVNFPFAVLDEWQCSLSSNTVQRYKKNRQNAIVVLNHVHPPLRGDVPPIASRRIAFCVWTWLAVHRHAVLGASGAQLLAMWVSWLIEGKAKM